MLGLIGWLLSIKLIVKKKLHEIIALYRSDTYKPLLIINSKSDSHEWHGRI